MMTQEELDLKKKSSNPYTRLRYHLYEVGRAKMKQFGEPAVKVVDSNTQPVAVPDSPINVSRETEEK